MQTLHFGDITIDALSDGYLDLAIEGFFPDAPAETWKRYPESVVGDKLRCALTTYLIRTGGRAVLVDTGLGPRIGRWDGVAGQLPGSLKAAGIRPEQVDVVIATHLHADHVGWNCTEVSGGRFQPTFPNAQYIVDRHEWEYWDATGARYLDRTIRPLFETNQLNLVEDGYEPASGITLLSTPGHTAGHISVLVFAGGEGAVVTGDAAHHPIEIEHPDWSPGMDQDRELSAHSRTVLVDRVEAEGLTLLGGHFPAPHAGRVVRVEHRRVYQPLTA